MRFALLITLVTSLVTLSQATDLLKNVFTVKSNETISLKCPISKSLISPIDYNNNLFSDDYTKYAKRANQLLIVQWYKNSMRLSKLALPHRYSLNSFNSADLNIRDVRASDAGHYSCKVINGYGSVTHGFSLVVKDTDSKSGRSKLERKLLENVTDKTMIDESFAKPYFTNLDSMEVRGYRKSVGSFIQFVCDSDGVPRPDVLWFKDGEVLSEEDYGITRSKWKLDLKDIRKSDQGNYTCQVFNKIGYINATYSLSVYEDLGPLNNYPQQHQQHKQPTATSYINTTIIADMDAILECQIQYSRSDLPPVKWMKQISRTEYDNYILQNNVDSTQIFNPTSILNNNDELKNFYATNTRAPLYWANQLPQEKPKLQESPSSFYSLNDLIGENSLNDQLDNMKLDDLMTIKKRRSVNDNTNTGVHYITLTASLSTEQKLRFNRNEGTYTSQLKINKATVKDRGVYVCFLDGKSYGKSYLNVLPNHFTTPSATKHQHRFPPVAVIKEKSVDYSIMGSLRSVGFLIVIVPVLLVLVIAIVSICCLKNMNAHRMQEKKNSGMFEAIKGSIFVCCGKSKTLEEDAEQAGQKKMYNKRVPTHVDLYTNNNNKSCTDTGKTGNSSFSDTSSTTATTVPYYATVPLLENSPPPPLPSSQPPAYYKSSEHCLERSESTPSMAYYKIVESEIHDEELAQLPVVDSDAKTCVSGNSRVYYQLAPSHNYPPQRYVRINNHQNFNSNNFYL